MGIVERLKLLVQGVSFLDDLQSSPHRPQLWLKNPSESAQNAP